MLNKPMIGDASMSWFNIASTVIGTVVGGFAGYAFSVVSKPRFEYMGIVGNLLQNSRLQCGARFRITYRWIGEKFVARNSMGWIGIYDDGGKQVHGSPGVWTWGNAVSINIVGEETLILFLVHPSDIKSTNDPALIIPPTPLPGAAIWQGDSSSTCFNYNGYNGQSICNNVVGSLRPNYRVRFRVTSENAHGTEKNLTLREVLDLCIKSRDANGEVMSNKSLQRSTKMMIQQLPHCLSVCLRN